LKQEPGAFNSTYEESIRYPDNYWCEKLNNKNEIHLFAKEDQKIIGTVSATFNEENEKANTAVIHGMYVNNLFRGKGIGKQLINCLLAEIKKSAGINKVKLWVKETQKAAMAVYENIGFKFSKRAGKNTVIMEKIL